MAQAGVVPTDPQARRLAAVLQLSESAIALYQPIVLPVTISALGLLLIAAGAHQSERRKAKRQVGGRRRRKALGPATKKAVLGPAAKKVSKASTANVVPLRPLHHRKLH